MVDDHDLHRPMERAYQQRVDLALDTALIGTWEWDPVADHVIWSENFERVHGFERGAFGNSLDSYSTYMHPEDRDRVRAALQSCAAGGPAYRVEYRLITPSGEVHHVEASGRRVADTNRLIGVCRDISDRVALLERERDARRDAERSELHYRTLAGTIPQQVWTARPEGTLDFVNERAVDYFGRPARQVIGDGWQTVVHPDDLPRVIGRWARSLETGEGYEVEFRLRRGDGIYRWHLGRAIPARDSSGNVVRWLGTNTDIDDSKRMLALMSTQIEVATLLIDADSFDSVAESLLEIVCRNLDWTCAQLWIVDHGADTLVRAAGWCGPGCSLDELAQHERMARGIGLPGRIWASGAPAWIEDVAADPNFPRARLLANLGLRSGLGFPLIVGGETTAVLEVFSRERRPYDETAVTMTATFGNQIGQFIQRIQAEHDLSDALDRLKRLQSVTDAALSHLSLSDLLDNLLPRIRDSVACDIVVVWLLDTATNELYPASIVGSSIPLRKDIRIKVGESLGGRAAAERQTKVARHATTQPFIHPDMRALGLESLVAVPLLCRDSLVGVVVVGARADITFAPDQIEFIEVVAQRLANAIDNASRYDDARESIRAKDRFLSIASHELKTPLTGILGWTMLLRGENDPLVQDEALRSIEESARQQARLIEDLLDSARIREGKLLLQPEECDLAEVVDRAARTIGPQAQERGVIIEIHQRQRPLLVFGERARLQQVVLNLLTNAIKFTSRGQHVRCTSDVAGSSATVTVTDEGSGIDPAFLPHVFNALEQDDRGRAAGGLGLGLHIVATIVKMHGGSITAESEGRGHGATFRLTLPMLESGRRHFAQT